YVTRVPDFEAFLKLDPGEVGLIISDLHSLIKTLHGDKLVREASRIITPIHFIGMLFMPIMFLIAYAMRSALGIKNDIVGQWLREY
ncbi:hypothetical protein FA15DRAFT_676656, partial [Coprinopsis marcescibilis]